MASKGSAVTAQEHLLDVIRVNPELTAAQLEPTLDRIRRRFKPDEVIPTIGHPWADEQDRDCREFWK